MSRSLTLSGDLDTKALPIEDGSINLDKIVNDVIRDVYDGNIGPDDMAEDLFTANALTLWGAVKDNFKVKKMLPDDRRVLVAMRDNCFLTAAFKNHHNVADMHALLRNEGGELLTWQEFKARALSLNANYNQRWLQTEWQTAIQSAQMGSDWREIEQQKDVYLQYKTIGDGRVRDEHAAFNGITAKVDDPIWDSHFPPNGWNCRCRIVKKTSGRRKVPEGLPAPDDAMFVGNVGKTGQVFNKNHPYFKGVPKGKAEKLTQKAQNEAKNQKINGEAE